MLTLSGDMPFIHHINSRLSGKIGRVGGKVDQVGGEPTEETVAHNFIPNKKALQKGKFPSAALRYVIEVYVMLLGVHCLL